MSNCQPLCSVDQRRKSMRMHVYVCTCIMLRYASIKFIELISISVFGCQYKRKALTLVGQSMIESMCHSSIVPFECLCVCVCVRVCVYVCAYYMDPHQHFNMESMNMKKHLQTDDLKYWLRGKLCVYSECPHRDLLDQILLVIHRHPLIIIHQRQ